MIELINNAGLFAAGSAADLLKKGGSVTGSTTSLWTQVLTVGGIVLAIGALIFLIAYFIKSGDTDTIETTSRPVQEKKSFLGLGSSRKRLREHRPRNPTLAETSGLPPVRTTAPNTGAARPEEQQ